LSQGFYCIEFSNFKETNAMRRNAKLMLLMIMMQVLIK